jgi:hypothetical protein
MDLKTNRNVEKNILTMPQLEFESRESLLRSAQKEVDILKQNIVKKSKIVKLFKCMNTSICGGCIYFVKMRRLLFTQNRDFFIHKVIFFFDTENRLAFSNTLHITIKSIDWGLEKHYCNKLIHLRKNNYEKQQNSTSKFCTYLRSHFQNKTIFARKLFLKVRRKS